MIAARDTANCTPINNALNSIVTKGQQSSRQLMFDCDVNHELTRRSAEKRKELNETTANINDHQNQSITIDDLQDLV